MENKGPLVPRNVYTQAIVRELNAMPYDPAHHNGMHNPYSGKDIICKEDYEEYIREYVYYRLCDKILSDQYTRQLALETKRLSKEATANLKRQKERLEKRNTEEICRISKHHSAEIQALYAQYRKTLFTWARRGVSAMLALIVGFVWFLSWYVPRQEADAYQRGQAATKGSTDEIDRINRFVQTILDNDASHDSNSASDNNSRPPSSSTPFSNSSNSSNDVSPGYITDPIPGISLSRTVYVSERSHTIHLNSGCSGMRNYFSMTYGDACAAGYAHCRTCF